ncbi:hypothetical protein VPK21_003186 [Sinorhizobium kummerowiae]|uniref:Uncharacterized protein n=1 Tax=Sinorhizobium kummerowiae TaxID=158892 RepID=A0ABY8T771_9HYPH|nr:hypothetical protein [Sinorhizobium kummerowiae]WHS93129.1 hypothetical protein PZL22_004235 [Sinorhizobium kummerowiae]WRW45026.1 hypothetical protein VPK21_003186 [Sinorhizobium kummerowiae]
MNRLSAFPALLSMTPAGFDAFRQHSPAFEASGEQLICNEKANSRPMSRIFNCTATHSDRRMPLIINALISELVGKEARPAARQLTHT